jgi:hypothetical protein
LTIHWLSVLALGKPPPVRAWKLPSVLWPQSCGGQVEVPSCPTIRCQQPAL